MLKPKEISRIPVNPLPSLSNLLLKQLVAKQLKEDKTIFEPQSKKLIPESTLKLGKSDVLLFKTLKYKINCSLQYDNPI